jgi:hypothetical protein
MTTKYTLSIMIAVFTSLASSAQKSVYTFPFENTYRLPSMQALINTNEISTTYQTVGNIYSTEIIGMGDETVEQTSTSFISDVQVLDAVRFLEFYLEDQLIAPGDGSGGLVELSIIYHHEHTRINVGSVIGILTFGIATLLGVPYGTTIIDLETEAIFYDREDYQRATHRGVGRGKKLQSLYSMSTRRAHQRALKNSLENLNTSIMNDPNLGKAEAIAKITP